MTTPAWDWFTMDMLMAWLAVLTAVSFVGFIGVCVALHRAHTHEVHRAEPKPEPQVLLRTDTVEAHAVIDEQHKALVDTGPPTVTFNTWQEEQIQAIRARTEARLRAKAEAQPPQ